MYKKSFSKVFLLLFLIGTLSVPFTALSAPVPPSETEENGADENNQENSAVPYTDDDEKINLN